MKEYPFLDLRLTDAHIADELKQAVCHVIDSGRYLHGEQTEQLEHEMALLCETRHCVAVSNGLDSLRLIIRAYKEMGTLRDGDQVIVPGNTYVASVLAVSDNRLEPVLCDARLDTLNMDLSLLSKLISTHPRVRAIMPVHLYGSPCWGHELVEAAHRHGLLIVEDNAQAINARASVPGLNGTFTTGGLGHAAGHSFYPTKNLGALGDAGAVLTNDDELAATVRALANYGADRRYHNIYKGLNCRIDEMQAAVLCVKLRHINDETERRLRVAATYDSYISNAAVTKPVIFSGMRQVWHQYVVMVPNRDSFRAYLKENGVGTDVHYATPPHRQSCYSELSSNRLPVTERIAREVVSLPIAAHITEHDASEIAEIVNNWQP